MDSPNLTSSPTQQSPPLLRPLPRRPFQNTRSGSSSEATTPRLNSHASETPSEDASNAADISRSRSILNLTSSTLFGIYAPSSFNEQNTSAPPTPWGTGAETPLRHGSTDDGFPSPRGGMPRGAELEARLLQGKNAPGDLRARSPTSAGHAPKSLPGILWRGSVRVVLLFAFGLAYGALIAHLHDNRNVAPVRVEGLNRASWRYLAFWGIAGVAMGSLLPWIDGLWSGDEGKSEGGRRASARPRPLDGVEWNDVVRSVGAFVGVAFAIRKLPWSSPLQLSLTLALANPFLWYLLDRTTAGFTLSSLIGLLGTASILTINPALIPSPTDNVAFGTSTSSNTTQHTQQSNAIQGTFGGALSLERVGVATWIASVLFCSCVCFGNIGRLFVLEKRSISPR